VAFRVGVADDRPLVLQHQPRRPGQHGADPRGHLDSRGSHLLERRDRGFDRGPIDGGDRIGVALSRIDFLRKQAESGSGKAGNRAAAAAVEEENRIPSAEVIALVAAGSRRFTNAQREWSVGEAMVLSGFSLTPMELIEQGDAKNAEILAKAHRG
jgi:hypothetical protein